MDLRSRLLSECPGAESVADVFWRAQSGWPQSWRTRVVAGPGQPLQEALRPGDLLLRRATGEGRLVTIDMIHSSGVLPYDEVAYEAEGASGGGFARVMAESVETGLARRVVDARGYVPDDQAILRMPLEHATSGAATLTAGQVGAAVNGTTTTAHIALVSPSGALAGTSTPASITAEVGRLTPTWVTEFSTTGGHTVTFDFAPGEPSATFNDPDASYRLAGTDPQRFASLEWGLFDPGTQAAMAIRGGHGSMRLLDELSISVFSRTWFMTLPFMPPLLPKRIVGYSDFTAVLLAVYSLLGWASLHGPMLSSTGGAASRTRLVQALTLAPSALYAGNVVQNNLTLVGARPTSSIRGVLLGGNLSLVDALYGSPYLPSLQGAILFVEEVGEEGRKIDRMIEGLKHRGASQQVRAVVVGRCSNIDSTHVATLLRNSWNKPCVAGLTAGHSGANHALWIGLEHELEFPAAGNPRLLIRP